MQPGMPAEFLDARHRAPHLGLALLHREEADEVKARTAHTGCVQPLQFFVGYAIVDNADAAVTVAVVQTFERVEQQTMIAAINRAMNDDAATETNRLSGLVKIAKSRLKPRPEGAK